MYVGRRGVELLTRALDGIRADRETFVLPDGVTPRYSMRLRREGYEGEVLVRFVVDAEGHAIPRSFRNHVPAGTVRPVGADADTYAEFVEAVRKALPRFRVEPARVAGCAVPQVVQQPFTFRLGP